MGTLKMLRRILWASLPLILINAKALSNGAVDKATMVSLNKKFTTFKYIIHFLFG
jgi:hypothetical protein